MSEAPIVKLQDLGPEQSWGELEKGAVPEWISRSVLLHAFQALHKTGMASKLFSAGSGGATREELFEGLDDYLASHFLRYLTIHGVLRNDGDRFVLREAFRPAASPIAGAQIGFYLEAYGPILQGLGQFMRQEVRYGEGIQRNGRALGQHCATLFSEYHTETILKALGERRARHILDLGCGAGQFLVDACRRDSQVEGTGIDIAEPAIEEARRLAQQYGVADRLSFVVADAFKPETWPQRCADADVITGAGVLHEHFRSGESAVISILNTYRDHLKRVGGIFILGEPELRYDLLRNDPDLYLVHVFTAQGFPRHREEWLELFSRTNLRCRAVYTRPTAGPRFNFYVLEAK